jgi:long-chain acyl-CoA synthetase
VNSFSLGHFVRHHALRTPGAPAIAGADGALDYRTFDRRAAGCALALRALGVGPADRVLFVLPNSVAWSVVYHGALQAGAIPVPINARLAAAEVAAIVADCEPAAVIADATLLAALRVAARPVDGRRAPAWVDVAGGVARDEADPQPIPPSDPGATGLILYSSGSTGLPKGVELSHANILWNAQAFAFDLLRLTPDDVGYSALPLSHVFGHTCLYSAFLFAGASVVTTDRFDPVDAFRDIAEHRATVFMGVPTMYWTMARAELPPGIDLTRWRACVSGGQALPIDVHERFEHRFGVQISEGYGMTEASPSVTGNRFHGRRKPGSAGEPYMGVELRVVDDEGHDVAAGETGELWVRGPGIARGYFRNEALTAQTFGDDGWLRTGDIGRLDADGFLFIVDRKKELIITGGYNVYPREIEEAVHRFDGVLETAAIGQPDERLGERIVAFVVVAEGHAVDVDALLAHCNAQLARYKVPREIRIVAALPRNATGKVDRQRLREIARSPAA